MNWKITFGLVGILGCRGAPTSAGNDASPQDAPIQTSAGSPSAGAIPAAAPGRANELPGTTRETLERAETIEIFHLDPTPREGGPFHGYAIIEKATLRPADRDALLAALDQGVATWNKQQAKCFNPRHGIRANSGARYVDLVVCFECQRIMVDGNTDPAVGVAANVEKITESIFARSGLKKRAP